MILKIFLQNASAMVMAQEMEVSAVIKIQANALARTIFINVLALSAEMVSTHFLNLLKWTVFNVTVIMEEALRRSVIK